MFAHVVRSISRLLIEGGVEVGLKEDVLEIVCSVLDAKAEEVKLDETLYDALGVDSTEMVELRIAVNKALGIELAQGEITNKQTPNQIVEVIEKKKQQA